MTDETIRSALRLANRRYYDNGGEATDETSQEKFLRRELAGSAPQYDPEAGWETAKRAGEMIAGMTTPGAVADFAGYLGGPSALENVRKGNYGSAALQTAGIIPGIGPFAKAGRIAEEARALEKAPAILPRPIGFRTAKGSTYEINPEGLTVRNKAPRPEHPGESGIQPQSKRTIYMSPEEINKLSDIQAISPHKRKLTYNDDTGHVGMLYTTGPDTGKIERRTIAKFNREPEIGLHPVEDWGGTRVHFGNPIVELFHPEKSLGTEKVPASARAAESAAVERPLMALHNTTPEKLELSHSAGGFPITSTGIVDPQHPFRTFGDVTLVGDRSWATPRDEEFRVFKGDPWTPNPTLTHRPAKEIAEDAVKNQESRLREISAIAPEQVRAFLTPEFKTFEDVKQASPLLTSERKGLQAKIQFDDYLSDLRERMMPYFQGSSISPLSVSHVSMVSPYYLEKNFPNLPSDLREEISNLPEIMRQLPQHYFESKNYKTANAPESTMFYKGAIVPHHLGPKVDKILRDLKITDIYHTDTSDPEKLVRAYEQFKHLQFADGGSVKDDVVEDALNLANRHHYADGGSVPDESSQNDFLRRELAGSARQYDPEAGKETAKRFGEALASLTTPGAIADAAGYLGGPSALENARRGNYGSSALQLASIIPGIGPLSKAARIAEEARAVEKAAPAIRAYHYSPTAFEKFEAGHAGTGAGGTSFGHGSGYWTAKEDDARMWQDRINAERGLPKGSGHMYEVDLKADPERMIDYNKYLHEQPEAVKDILINKLGYEPSMFEKPAEGSFAGGKPRGDMAVPQSEGALKAWRDAGIHGVQYYDPNNSYRGYVTFAEDPATILRRYKEGGFVKDDVIEDALRLANRRHYGSGGPVAPYGVVDLGDKIIVGAPHGQAVELSDDLKQKIRDTAEKHGAWYEGTGGDIAPNKSLVSNYRGSWDDAHAASVKGYPIEYLTPLFSNIDVNKQHEAFADPNRTILDSLVENQDKAKYFKDRRYDENVLRDFLLQGSEKDVDLFNLAQMPATKENLHKFFKTGENLMWPDNWQEYPNNLGKLAKKSEESRNRFLLEAPPGVYFTGAGHIPELKSMKKDLPVIGGERSAYASGGQVWDKPRPKGLGKPSHLTSKQKASAKAAAKAAGRPYPNLVDNMKAKMAKADGGRTPAWQRSEGKDPEGGLNAKGRAAYNRQNPGKPGLKPPAPHPKTDKDASRRASFCARMKGMRAKLTSSETANDPDSRINKSLRAWNCRADGGPVMHPDIIDALRLADRQFFDDGGFAGKNARYAGRGMNFSPTVPQAAPQVVNSPMAQQAATQTAQQINPWQISNRNASRDDSRFQDYPKSYPDFEPAVNSQSRPVLKQDTSYSSDQAPQSIPYTGSPIIEQYAPQVNSPQSIPYAGNPAIEKYAPPPAAAPAFSPPMAPQQMAGSPSSFAGTPSFSSPAMPQSIPYTGSPVIEQYAPPPTPPLMPAAAPQQSPQSIPYVGNPAIETYAPPTAAPVTPLPQSVAPQQVAAGAASLSGTAPQFAGVPQAANFGNAAANTALSANQRPAIQNYAGNNYSNMGGNRFPMYPMYPTYSQNRAPFFGKNGGGSNYAAPQAASNPYQRGQNAQRQMPFIGKNGGGSAY